MPDLSNYVDKETKRNIPSCMIKTCKESKKLQEVETGKRIYKKRIKHCLTKYIIPFFHYQLKE